jgi:hypothetical protein
MKKLNLLKKYLTFNFHHFKSKVIFKIPDNDDARLYYFKNVWNNLAKRFKVQSFLHFEFIELPPGYGIYTFDGTENVFEEPKVLYRYKFKGNLKQLHFVNGSDIKLRKFVKVHDFNGVILNKKLKKTDHMCYLNKEFDYYNEIKKYNIPELEDQLDLFYPSVSERLHWYEVYNSEVNKYLRLCLPKDISPRNFLDRMITQKIINIRTKRLNYNTYYDELGNITTDKSKSTMLDIRPITVTKSNDIEYDYYIYSFDLDRYYVDGVLV